MKSKRVLGPTAWIVCAAAVLAPIAARAQQASTPIPDITGSWERARDASIPAQPQPPLKPQHLKEWQAKVQAARESSAKGEPLADRATACLPEGMPTMMGATFPLEILQSKGQVTIIEEAFTQIRRILLDRPQKPVDDVEPGFYGHSVGHWEGGVLVVDTVGVRENVFIGGGMGSPGVPHSKDMRIKERISLGANGILRDDITIEDPVTFEKPWTYTFGYRRMPGYTLLEYVCEDNREYADEKGLQKIRIETPGR